MFHVYIISMVSKIRATCWITKTKQLWEECSPDSYRIYDVKTSKRLWLALIMVFNYNVYIIIMIHWANGAPYKLIKNIHRVVMWKWCLIMLLRYIPFQSCSCAFSVLISLHTLLIFFLFCFINSSNELFTSQIIVFEKENSQDLFSCLYQHMKWNQWKDLNRNK